MQYIRHAFLASPILNLKIVHNYFSVLEFLVHTYFMALSLTHRSQCYSN